MSKASDISFALNQEAIRFNDDFVLEQTGLHGPWTTRQAQDYFSKLWVGLSEGEKAARNRQIERALVVGDQWGRLKTEDVPGPSGVPNTLYTLVPRDQWPTVRRVTKTEADFIVLRKLQHRIAEHEAPPCDVCVKSGIKNLPQLAARVKSRCDQCGPRYEAVLDRIQKETTPNHKELPDMDPAKIELLIAEGIDGPIYGIRSKKGR